MMKIVLMLIGALSLTTPLGQARSAELKIVASRAVWTVLQKIGPEFERQAGHKLTLTTGLRLLIRPTTR